jgi:DNA-binding winged helix-turn-helix (wHTH) protein
MTQRANRLCGFSLGEWMVEPGLNRISHGGKTVHLRPRLMDVLVFLARHPGEVAAKDEILAAVWGRPFLAESVLSRTVAELRQALGDDDRSPRYIETILKRGYRLVAPVAWTPEPDGVAGGGAAACVLSYSGRRTGLPQGTSVIGRAADAAVRIDSMDVSRHHARIVVSAGVATLEDLGSKNGTRLNGTLVTGPTDLANGDRIEVGPADLVFHIVGLPGTTSTKPPAAGPPEPGAT